MAANDIIDKQFKPGQSGNPKGRPPGSENLSTKFRRGLAEMAPSAVIDSKFVQEYCKGRKRLTNADIHIARVFYEAYVKGESWALKEIADRTEGKAMQAVEVSGKDGETLKFTLNIGSTVVKDDE